MESTVTGKVFISCGQHLPDEKEAASRVHELLAKEFHLKPYLAKDVQSLYDLMTITKKELPSSDYYLFIDFRRRSIFTHQELALAHHLGFGDQVIFLRQEGSAAPEGFLRYILGNADWFNTNDELIEKVRERVRARGWKPEYSRNLVVGPLRTSDLFHYQDHTGSSLNVAWVAQIENKRPDIAAVGPCKDRAYLKWADQASYEPTLLPQDSGSVALCAVRPDKRGLFLHSLRDHIPREPIVLENGDYELMFNTGFR
jgi:hypothetical protein